MLRDLYSIAKNRSLSSYMIQVAVVLFLIESSWQVRGRSFAACEVLVRKRVFCVCGDNVASADGVGFVASLHKCSQCRERLWTLRHERVVCLQTSPHLSLVYLRWCVQCVCVSVFV